jgi:hypothetical protein
VQIIPLQPVPSQTLLVDLDGQNAQIDVYTTNYGLFLDLYVSNVLIIGGVICQNLNRIVRDAYLGFQGDLCFIDSQGTTDPVYTGLGARYNLAYLEVADLPAGEG